MYGVPRGTVILFAWLNELYHIVMTSIFRLHESYRIVNYNDFKKHTWYYLSIEKVTNFCLLHCCERRARTTLIIKILHFESRQLQRSTNPILWTKTFYSTFFSGRWNSEMLLLPSCNFSRSSIPVNSIFITWSSSRKCCDLRSGFGRLDIHMGLWVNQTHYFLLVACACGWWILYNYHYLSRRVTDLACHKKAAVLVNIPMQSEQRHVLPGSSCRLQGQGCHFLWTYGLDHHNAHKEAAALQGIQDGVRCGGLRLRAAQFLRRMNL